MKNIIRILVCCLVSTGLYAQQQQITPPISHNGKSEWMTFKTAEQTSASQLAQNKAKFKLKENDALRLLEAKADNLGFVHYRFLQEYKGVPIEHAIFLMHEKDSRVIKSNGNLLRDLDIDVIPTLNEHTALEVALQSINASRYAWQELSYETRLKERRNDTNATFYPTAELVIIDTSHEQKAVNCRLAYRFNIYAIQPLTNQKIYVDAHTGEILDSQELIRSCTDTPASGITNYYDTVNFTGCYDGNRYILKNSDVQVFDANNATGRNGTPFTDTDGVFVDDSTKTAVEVLWAIDSTYQYFRNVHNLTCFDSDCMPIHSWVHHGQNLNNAYYSPFDKAIVFGDGDGVSRTSYTSIDIVAHEMIHMLTDNTADLDYERESGSLNESFSDIFGEVIERYMLLGTNDWTVGADIFAISGASGLRSLSDPKDPTMAFQQPDTYQGNLWFDISSVCNGGNDHCGVHTNSGIQNHWFYLLSEGGSGVNDNGLSYNVNGIGMSAAAAIAYRMLSVYLTPKSGYADARVAAVQAAVDLYGNSPEIIAQTQEAWNAVGVLSDRVVDSLALVAFYNSTDGANWTNAWDFSQPMDTWYGVTVRNKRVACLDLDGVHDCNGTYSPESLGNNLTGSISPALGALSELIILSLGYNNLVGAIPHELGNLTKAHLFYLNNNQLTGSIPSELGNLSSAKYFALSDNQVTDSIPVALGDMSNLEYLYLNNNNLIGTVPYSIGDLNLNRLYLRNNPLTCYMPNLANLCGISPDNIDIHTNTNLSAWTDFCNNEIGLCDTDIHVYPGDCDNNGIVNQQDFTRLSRLIGNADKYQILGPLRPSATLEWMPQQAYKWLFSFLETDFVHGDSDGSGDINLELDEAAIYDNFGKTVGSQGASPSSDSTNTSLYFVMEPNQAKSDSLDDASVYNLWVVSDVDEPILAHAIDGIIAFETPVSSVTMDVSNSSLNPAADFDIFISDTLYFSLSRTDLTNQSISDEPIAIIVVGDVQGGDSDALNAIPGDGRVLQIPEELQNSNFDDLKNATGSVHIDMESIEIPVNRTNFYHSSGENIQGGSPPLPTNITTFSGSCNTPAKADVTVSGGTPPYTYMWSTGDTLITMDTTVQFTNFEVGTYGMIVSDSTGRNNSMTVQIDASVLYNDVGNQIECDGSMFIVPDLCVGIEGAYNSSTGIMNNNLRMRGFLPDKQPYNIEPWNYQGAEGLGWTSDDYPENTVDWVLVSLRASMESNTQIGRAAAILQQDGCLYFPDGGVRLNSQVDSAYVVIQHRNHIAVMTPQPVAIVNNTLTHDFRLEDSYRDATSFGQKQLYGDWVMFAGDCDQVSDLQGYDINGSDKALWISQNGNFAQYLSSDMNLDGDVNGADKGVWLNNNGISSRVPK